MQVIALSVKEAEEFLAKHERHYRAPVQPICAIGVGEIREAASVTGDVVSFPKTVVIHGAAVLGRNSAEEAELAHIYVDGASQGYSLLYGACWRALKALGYRSAVL